MVNPNYVSSTPVPGRTIITIHSVQESADRISLEFDIGIGPALGHAFYQYQITGQWPLRWEIVKTSAAAIVRRCALKAIQASHPEIKDLRDAAGVSLAVDLDYTDSSHTHVKVCRSYPISAYKIDPNDIRIDKNVSWAAGSPEYIRIHLMAAKAGLPVILVDHHCEKQSPMVDWCADNGIVLLPSLLPAGDYRLPDGKTLVDRKANLLELYNDFAMPDNRLRYENAAMIASAHKSLLWSLRITSKISHRWLLGLLQFRVRARLPMAQILPLSCSGIRRSFPIHRLFFAINPGSARPSITHCPDASHKVKKGLCLGIHPLHPGISKIPPSRSLHPHRPLTHGGT